MYVGLYRDGLTVITDNVADIFSIHLSYLIHFSLFLYYNKAVSKLDKILHTYGYNCWT